MIIDKLLNCYYKRLKGVDTLSNEEVKQILPELMNGEMLGDDE